MLAIVFPSRQLLFSMVLDTGNSSMNEDALNMQIRKFLKKTGIMSQRSIEQAVRDGLEDGKIKIGDSFEATISLSIRELGLDVDIVDTIKIEA
jgi:hypothetical protein